MPLGGIYPIGEREQCVCVCVCTCVPVHVCETEREKEREREIPKGHRFFLTEVKNDF